MRYKERATYLVLTCLMRKRPKNMNYKKNIIFIQKLDTRKNENTLDLYIFTYLKNPFIYFLKNLKYIIGSP